MQLRSWPKPWQALLHVFGKLLLCDFLLDRTLLPNPSHSGSPQALPLPSKTPRHSLEKALRKKTVGLWGLAHVQSFSQEPRPYVGRGPMPANCCSLDFIQVLELFTVEG